MYVFPNPWLKGMLHYRIKPNRTRPVLEWTHFNSILFFFTLWKHLKRICFQGLWKEDISLERVKSEQSQLVKTQSKPTIETLEKNLKLFKVNKNTRTTLFLFQNPLKTSENQRFWDVFRGYWKRNDVILVFCC